MANTVTTPLRFADRVKFKLELQSAGYTLADDISDDELVERYNALNASEPAQAPSVIEPEPVSDADDEGDLDEIPEPEGEPDDVQDDDQLTVPAPTNPAQPQPQPQPQPVQDPKALLEQLLDTLTPQPTVINNGLSKDEIIALIQQHAKDGDTITVQHPAPVEPKQVKNTHRNFKEVLELMLTRDSDGKPLQPYLVGPAGSGKTYLATQLADALDVDFYSSGAVQTAYELIGYNDANGSYSEPPLYHAFKHGGLFLFDELDACHPKAITTLNQLLANSVYTFPNGETVTRHEQFYAIAAANTVGDGATLQYVSRNPLDKTALDRFIPVELNYDIKMERKLALATYTANGGENKDLLTPLDAIISEIRKHCEQINSLTIISPRTRIQCAGLLAKTGDVETAVKRVCKMKFTADQWRSLVSHLKTKELWTV